MKISPIIDSSCIYCDAPIYAGDEVFFQKSLKGNSCVVCGDIESEITKIVPEVEFTGLLFPKGRGLMV